MKAMLQPTPETFDVHANGQTMRTRIWRGYTEANIAIEAYVVAIVPVQAEHHAALASELPEFMRPARESLKVDFDKYEWPGELSPEQRAKNIHQTGSETGE
jgi:hypothetical protein